MKSEIRCLPTVFPSPQIRLSAVFPTLLHRWLVFINGLGLTAELQICALAKFNLSHLASYKTVTEGVLLPYGIM